MRHHAHVVLIVSILVLASAGCGRASSPESTAGAPAGTAGTVSRPGAAGTVPRPGAAGTVPRPGAAGTVPRPVPLRVSPAVGGPSTRFTFGFRAPAARVAATGTATSLSLSVVGAPGSGCVAARSLALRSPAPGVEVRAAIGPAQLGGRWCAGGWTARAVELERAVCAAGQVCPQFIRVVAVAGPARFRVAG